MLKLKNSNATFLVIFKHCAFDSLVTFGSIFCEVGLGEVRLGKVHQDRFIEVRRSSPS